MGPPPKRPADLGGRLECSSCFVSWPQFFPWSLELGLPWTYGEEDGG